MTSKRKKPAITVEQFPSAAEWKEALSARSRVRLQRALFDLAQAFPYLSTAERRELLAAILEHPARRDPTLASAWVEGVFRVGGPEVEAALERHAGSGVGSAASRRLAETRALEMRRERKTRLLLARNASDGAVDVVETSTRPAGLFAAPLSPSFGRHGDPARDKAEITLSPDQIAEQLRALASSPSGATAALDAGFAPVVATDCDGTTWKHDIGEALFVDAVERRLFREDAAAALGDLLQRYGFTPRGDANDDARTLLEAYEAGELHSRGVLRGRSKTEITAEFYVANLWCFAGHTVATLKAWARELFEGPSGFKGKIFDGLEDVLEAARTSGLIPYAVSASNQWIVEVGAEYLGIPPWRVAGLRAELAAGRVTTRIVEPVTFGPGKVDAVRRLTGGRPAVAMGDSVDATDRELLESALFRVAVEPKASRHEFVIARARENWRFLDYTRTRDGEDAGELSR